MTNEEAINQIEEFMVIDDWSLVYLPYLHDALEIAIEALKQDRPHGEWKQKTLIDEETGKTILVCYSCPCCGSILQAPKKMGGESE